MKLMIQDVIYHKAMRLSAVIRSHTSTGQLITMMTSDCNQIINFTCTILVIFVIPITVL